MDTPQQPEIERSGRGNDDPEGRSVSERGKSEKDAGGKQGPVPPGNRSTHGPDAEEADGGDANG